MIAMLRVFLHSHHSYVIAVGLLVLALGQLMADDRQAATSSAIAAASALGLKFAGSPAPGK